MEIPEITDSQLKLMIIICGDPTMSVFSQAAFIESDPLALKVVLKQAEEAVEHLVFLKMLKEITADHLEQIEKANAESGRAWKVFEITALGRAMFQAYTTPAVH